MRFFVVRPEVPGQLGDNTVLDRSGERPRVNHLHYMFEGWLGDELITSYPAFAATRSLADQFTATGLSGVQLRDMEVSRSEDFMDQFPGRELPEFVELVITGTPGVDDFGIDAKKHLVLSDRALNIVNRTNPVDMDVIPVRDI